MDCRIRTWNLSDAAELAAVISNKKVQDNLRDGLPYPYTEENGREYISEMLAADADQTFAFAITVEDRVVGSIGVFRQGNVHRQTAELGYYIGEAYWGKGIMTEAVKQICDYVFEHSDIIRIYAEPFSYNTASCRVLEKAGFRYEGTLRKNAVKNGKVIDMKMYSLIKQEAEEIRPEHPMRRHDREVTEPAEVVEIMERCDVCRICLNDEDGYPYILPLNFGMTVCGGQVTLWFHGATAGRKYELMKRDPRVSFEMDCAHRLVTEEDTGNCTMEYESVIGRGQMELLPEEEKEAALDILMAHYHKEDFAYNRAVIPQTNVFKLTVSQMTGKRRMKRA